MNLLTNTDYSGLVATLNQGVKSSTSSRAADEFPSDEDHTNLATIFERSKVH